MQAPLSFHVAALATLAGLAVLLGEAYAQPATATSSSSATILGDPGANGVWESEDSYWRSTYPKRPYYNSSRSYDTYEPAYRYGVETYYANRGKSYEELDPSRLDSGWTSARGSSSLNWNDAQMATRDAYDRMYQRHNGIAR